MNKQPKLTIISGYPPKIFKFTGKFQKRELGHYKARRNKKIVYVPIYKSADGEILIDMNQQTDSTLLDTSSEISSPKND